MDRSRLELEPGIWLDARRAVWLPPERVLIVADLHLGYAWAHRHHGNLLPVSGREHTAERLRALVESYAPRELVLLGDIVHRALFLQPLKEQLCALFGEVGVLTKLRLIAGNHDAQLAPLLRSCGINAELASSYRIGAHLLVHGDAMQKTPADANADGDVRPLPGGRIFVGHEHPAISVSDGAARYAKCPCFLIGPDFVVLPAFSHWAAGTEVRGRELMSPLLRDSRPQRAIAVVADKLLPLRL